MSLRSSAVGSQPPPARGGGRRAFTLMEMLVALGIFAITAGLIADLFLVASRQQSRTIALSRVQGDARLVIETIARELREGSLDVAADIPAGTLALRDADGQPVRFRRTTSGCPTRSSACVEVGRPASDGGIAWASLTGADGNAEAFRSWVAPAADPFVWVEGSGYGANQQPRATVYLRLSVATGRAGERTVIEAQTTVASRVYRR